MESNNVCPHCGFKLPENGVADCVCPQCSLAIPKETIWTKLMSPWFIAKAGLGLTLGIIPGLILHALGHEAAIVIVFTGGFIGLAFAVAKVSVSGVAAAGAAVAVSRVVPRPLQGAVMENMEKLMDDESDGGDDERPRQTWP